MSELIHLITTEDGRQLSVIEDGDPNGIPILFQHGTPGSKLLFQPWIDDALEKNIRLLSYNRPGFGGSTPCPGRKIADVAQNVTAIAKTLDIDRLLTWGISGGGPHALACAALLPDLVTAVASLACPTPYGIEDFDWIAGMGKGALDEINAALEGRAALEAFTENETYSIKSATAEQLVAVFQNYISPPDAEVLTKDYAQFTLDSILTGIHESREGWVDDNLAFISDWGFSLDQIKVPVLLMQGAQDHIVPLSHYEWLAVNIPGVDARLLPDDGHLSLKVNCIPQVHTWLLEKYN